MLTRSEMKFVPGTILRKEMLSDLYSYPRMVTESLFAGFSDGILYGLEWVKEKSSNHHIIKPGALKLHGKVYFMDSSLNVEETLGTLSDGTRYRLYFREKKECCIILKNSLNIFDLELKPVLKEEWDEADKDGFYYAYILCSNGELRKMEDSKIGGLFASDDEYGFKLPPEIVKESLEPVYEKKSRKHSLDYLMLKDLCENKPISVGLVKMYLDEAGCDCGEDELKNPVELLKKLKSACEKLEPETVVQIREIPDDSKKDTKKLGGML